MKKFKKAITFLVALVMIISLAACGTTDNNTNKGSDAASSVNTDQSKVFPKFQGTDFDGNAVDETMFSENDVTVLYFWFNGCSACVDEMPALEDFNKKLQEKGAALVGINVEAGVDKKSLEEAKKILSDQGVTYKNILINEGKEIFDYINDIKGFPTTVLVDSSGNIIGNSILGSIDGEKRMADILRMVEDVAAGREASLSEENFESDDVNALIQEENDIFTEHMDVWNRIFDSIPNDKAAQMSQEEYVSLLKNQIKTLEGSFSKEEMMILNDDIQKIEEIEKKIKELEVNDGE